MGPGPVGPVPWDQGPRAHANEWPMGMPLALIPIEYKFNHLMSKYPLDQPPHLRPPNPQHLKQKIPDSNFIEGLVNVGGLLHCILYSFLFVHV